MLHGSERNQSDRETPLTQRMYEIFQTSRRRTNTRRLSDSNEKIARESVYRNSNRMATDKNVMKRK